MKIVCENNKIEKKYEFGTTLKEIADDHNISLKYPVLGALVDNTLQELSLKISRPHKVNFIDITHKDGMRMYFRSLYFVLMKAVKDIMPDADLMIEHRVSKGYFCEIKGIDLTKNKRWKR